MREMPLKSLFLELLRVQRNKYRWPVEKETRRATNYLLWGVGK
jgi:hypothetical protein